MQAEKDDCAFCLGEKGGVKGNENVLHGIVVCDYCTVLVINLLDGHEATKGDQLAALAMALELPLLFHAGGRPNVERWEEITDTREMTTKVMCDTIRVALGQKEPSDDHT